MIIITMDDMMVDGCGKLAMLNTFGMKDKVLPFGYHPLLNKQNNDKV